jgi:hypothetical protein
LRAIDNLLAVLFFVVPRLYQPIADLDAVSSQISSDARKHPD